MHKCLHIQGGDNPSMPTDLTKIPP